MVYSTKISLSKDRLTNATGCHTSSCLDPLALRVLSFNRLAYLFVYKSIY